MLAFTIPAQVIKLGAIARTAAINTDALYYEVYKEHFDEVVVK